MARRVTRGGASEFKRWRFARVKPGIETAGRLFHQKIHVQTTDEVIFATPVGNPSLWISPAPPGYTGGRARGSWQSSVHIPILTEPGTIDKTGQSTAQRAASAVREIPFASKSFTTSAVPYMLRLNDGWSKQMPADFIERAFDRVGAQFA